MVDPFGSVCESRSWWSLGDLFFLSLCMHLLILLRGLLHEGSRSHFGNKTFIFLCGGMNFCFFDIIKFQCVTTCMAKNNYFWSRIAILRKFAQNTSEGLILRSSNSIRFFFSKTLFKGLFTPNFFFLILLRRGRIYLHSKLINTSIWIFCCKDSGFSYHHQTVSKYNFHH